MMDSNDVTITVTTSSTNGRQGEAEIDAFAARIVELAHDMLSDSGIEVVILKHRLVRR